MSQGYDAADLADKIRGGEVDAHIGAVLSDHKRVGNLLLAAERAGLDDAAPLVELVDRTGQTDTLRNARQQAHVATMNAATGLNETRSEATGYDRLLGRLTPAAQQVTIKGPKGSGKTTKALDLTRRLYAEFDGQLSVFTNIRGPDEHDAVTFGETTSELLEWVRDTPGEKVAILDELSTTMNAHAEPGGEIRVVISRFINALRKGRGGSTRLLLVAHEHDTDTAAILRNQNDVVIRADGKKDEGLIDCATVYDGWQDYQADEPAFKVRGLQDVPQSSAWSTDTNYFAHFENDLDAPRKQIRRGKLVENWEDYQELEASTDGGESQRVKCRGVKDDGTGCGALTDHESGFCAYHRDQWDGEADDRFNDDGGGT